MLVGQRQPVLFQVQRWIGLKVPWRIEEGWAAGGGGAGTLSTRWAWSEGFEQGHNMTGLLGNITLATSGRRVYSALFSRRESGRGRSCEARGEVDTKHV